MVPACALVLTRLPAGPVWVHGGWLIRHAAGVHRLTQVLVTELQDDQTYLLVGSDLYTGVPDLLLMDPSQWPVAVHYLVGLPTHCVLAVSSLYHRQQKWHCAAYQWR